MTNRIAWNKGKKTGLAPWKGKKRPPFSEQTKLRMSLGQKGKIRSSETRKKIADANRGSKSKFWQGGITDLNKKIRNGIEFRLWREAVFARDNWICQKTFIRGKKIVAHHIYNFADNPNLRTAIDNGITLSEESHKEFHKIYGKKNNTREQLEEFLRST